MATLALAASACLGPMRVEQTISPSFADLAAIKSIAVVDESGNVIVTGTLSTAELTTGRFERTATLRSPTNGATRGTAEIDIDRANGLSEEEITVKLEALPYPTSCKLMADGRELTIFSSTENGKIDLKLSRRVMMNGK